MDQAKVYFTPSLEPADALKLYEAVGISLTGRVAVKVHSGEKGNQNFLPPAFYAPVMEALHGTVCECNTAYTGARNTVKKHLGLLKEHGWEDAFPVDLMDAEGPDAVLPVNNGRVLKENLVGKHLLGYDSLLVFSHFKGHPMGGYGGALKQLSIGCASSAGKANIHSGGRSQNPKLHWAMTAKQDTFLEAMADAAGTVMALFPGKAVYISVMKNLSVDCDCCAKAEDPCMRDIGMLASSDPVALDKACLDLIYAAADDPGQKHFLERVESRHGAHTIEAAEALGLGSTQYELIRL